MAVQNANTNSNSDNGANVNATDAVANILVTGLTDGEDGDLENKVPPVEDDDGADEPPVKSKPKGSDSENDDAEDDSDEDDDTDDEADESDDDETDETDGDDDESDETWAGVLGIDDSQIALDDEGNFVGVNVKIDGESDRVDLKTLIAGYQNNRNNTNKSKALAEERKTFEVDRDKTVATYTQKLDDVNKLTQYLHQNMMKEFNGINWDQLRVSDPAEYAALMQDYNVRQQDINAVYAAIEQERNDSQQQLTQTQQQKMQGFVKEQMDLLVSKNPEWSDKEKLKNAMSEMGSFAVETYGFSENEFNSVMDHRLIELLKDAKKYRDGTKVAKNKLNKKIPKFVRSSNKPVVNKSSKLDKLTKTAKTAKGAKKRDAQTSAIAELLTGEL